MLLNLLWIRPVNHDRQDQIISRPPVVFIGPRDVQRQGRPVFIHHQMDFATLFAPIGRIAASLLPAQAGWRRFTVNRLLLTTDLSLLLVVLDHLPQYRPEDARLLPVLKSIVDHTASDPNPVLVDRFPLATRPQHIPDPIQGLTVISPGPTRSLSFRRRGQQGLNDSPQFIRHLEIIDIFRFCVMIFTQDAISLELVVRNSIFQQVRLFSIVHLFTDRFLSY
jgi:hypothetical protein